MKILMNSTKTMDLETPAPARITLTEPVFRDRAAALVAALRKLGPGRLLRDLALSQGLLKPTRADLALWGEPDRPRRPALFAFTGLVYKHLDAPTLTAPQRRDAQQRMRILSGLYGLLRPLDGIEAYRVEIGARWAPPRAKNLTLYWREILTEALNGELKPGEPIIDLASQEYVKALAVKDLAGPVISPVFKEVRPDGSLKTAPVHGKIARGSLARFILTAGAKRPADLLAFGEHGWEASSEPPAGGPWLFTRPARG